MVKSRARPSPGRARGGRREWPQPYLERRSVPPRGGASGALTGFAGGLDAKRYLLDLDRPARRA
jgi:hypothetical protein